LLFLCTYFWPHKTQACSEAAQVKGSEKSLDRLFKMYSFDYYD